MSFSGMQLNPSPILSTAHSPTMYKDSWQQRRYNFLSKNSMLGGELKDDETPTNTFDRRPTIGSSQLIKSGSMDSDGSNVRRESILGMAVTGVRNLLAVSR